MAPPGTLRLPVVVGGLLPFASGGPQRAGRLARHCAFTRQVDVTLQVVPQQNAGQAGTQNGSGSANNP